MTGHIDPTNHTADIVRRQMEVADDSSSKGVREEE